MNSTNIGYFKNRFTYFLFFILIFSATVIYAVNEINDKQPIGGDATENVSAIYNLIRNKLFSTEPYYVFWKNEHYEKENVHSNMYREPFPIAFSALFVCVFNTKSSHQSFDDFIKDDKTIYAIKYSQVFWVTLCILLLHLFIRFTTENQLYSLIATALFVFCAIHFKTYSFFLNHFYTETQASALLIGFLYFSMKGLKESNIGYYFVSGLMLGLLSLTKSLIFYVFPFSIVLLLLVFFIKKISLKSAATNVAVFSMGFMLFVVPWLARNWILFNKASISSRSEVIYVRSIKNDICKRKLFAAFYAYSPRIVKGIIEQHSDIRESDFQYGANYAALNRSIASKNGQDRQFIKSGCPEKAISYFGRFFSLRTRMIKDYSNKEINSVFTIMKVENELFSVGVKNILRDFTNHIIATPIFAWRGLWNNFFGALGNMALYFLFIVGSFFFLFKKNVNAIFSIGIIFIVYFMLSFLTHFLPRYSFFLMPAIFGLTSIFIYDMLLKGDSKAKIWKK